MLTQFSQNLFSRASLTTSIMLTVLTSAVLSSAGCPKPENPNGDAGVDVGTDAGVVEPAPFAISNRNQLTWKRGRAVEQDLMAALELSKNEVCNELGQYSCVDYVHLVPLGGNDPFVKSQYEQLAEPLPTTSIALERTALSACINRVDKDKAGTPVVFTQLDLQADRVDPLSPAFAGTVDDLMKRLLARHATAAEVSALAPLTTDENSKPISARDTAVLLCFSVATMSEFLLQ